MYFLLTLYIQCTVSNAIEDTLSYILHTTANLNVTGRVAPPLVIIGGGCPTKTETIAKLSKFFYTLEVKWQWVFAIVQCFAQFMLTDVNKLSSDKLSQIQFQNNNIIMSLECLPLLWRSEQASNVQSLSLSKCAATVTDCQWQWRPSIYNQSSLAKSDKELIVKPGDGRLPPPMHPSMHTHTPGDRNVCIVSVVYIGWTLW